MNKFKTMGIAVAMALALTAFVGAGTASAATFKAPGAAEGTETTWSGARSGANHKLSLGGDTFTCENVSFAGGTIGPESSEANVNPELKTCSWLMTTVSWTTNGCKLRFRINAGGYPAGTVDIHSCAKPMTFSTAGCQMEVGNQNGIGTVEYKNTITEGKETLAILANLKNITYTRVGGAGCAVNKPGTFSDGTYTGEWTVKGTRSGSSAPIGVSVPLPTKFAVESAPTAITGVNTGSATHFKAVGGNNTTCKSISLSGTMAATSAESITVVPTYKECTINGASVPDGYVSAGACGFVFHVNATFDIVGANCESNPITITSNGCITVIGPQSGIASGFSFLNEGGWGAPRNVAVSGGTGSKVTYTSWGPKCSFQGTASTGIINNPAKLSASSPGIWLE